MKADRIGDILIHIGADIMAGAALELVDPAAAGGGAGEGLERRRPQR